MTGPAITAPAASELRKEWSSPRSAATARTRAKTSPPTVMDTAIICRGVMAARESLKAVETVDQERIVREAKKRDLWALVMRHLGENAFPVVPQGKRMSKKRKKDVSDRKMRILC